MTIWLISDTHFGHANILTFKRADGVTPVRPFSSVEEMDDTMIQRWNSRVKSSDHVYHLGDFCMRTEHLTTAKALNGHLRLVRGNHDIFKTRLYIAHGFEEIHGMRVLADCVLTHAPIHPLSINKRWYGNLHGHVHERIVPALKSDGTWTSEQWNGDPRYLNCSVEQPHMNYGPITIEEAISLLKEKQK